MKRVLLISVVGLVLTVNYANAALTTQQSWDFTNASWDSGNGYWTSQPESAGNPGSPYASIGASVNGWNEPEGTFYGVDWLELYIPNYINTNPIKIIDIWVQYTPVGGLGEIDINSDPNPLTVEEVIRKDSTILQGGWAYTYAQYILHPNPFYEYINLDFILPAGASNSLGSISVVTECIPAPGALLLCGIGASVVGWLRRRNTL